MKIHIRKSEHLPLPILTLFEVTCGRFISLSTNAVAVGKQGS